MDFDREIFKGKTFSTLLEDIYVNRKKKDEQIRILIDELRPFVKSLNDATMLIPIIKDYMEIGVKNDEHLVKMAGIVQRALCRVGTSVGDELVLSDDEKQELFDTLEQLEDDKDIREKNKKVKSIKDILSEVNLNVNS